MIYRVLCGACGVQEFEESIHTVAFPHPCPTCGKDVPKLWEAPHYVEDRLRLWRNNYGTRFSQAIGQEMPETRAERKAVERQRGIEFISPSELGREHKEAVEYRKHIATGGQPVPEKPTQLAPKKGALSSKIMNHVKTNYAKGIPWRKTLGQE